MLKEYCVAPKRMTLYNIPQQNWTTDQAARTTVRLVGLQLKNGRAVSTSPHPTRGVDRSDRNITGSMSCSKVSRIAAIIYHNCFGDNTKVPAADPSLDYGANYANMLGFTSTDFWELMRLYIVIHA